MLDGKKGIYGDSETIPQTGVILNPNPYSKTDSIE